MSSKVHNSQKAECNRGVFKEIGIKTDMNCRTQGAD